MASSGIIPDHQPAVLALADGSIFLGVSIGALGEATGEVVFNTSMTGYQEILTDPSYAEQIVTLTYPHIGNVGINHEDIESKQIWAKALIIRELSLIVSNWRAEQTLAEYLKLHNIVTIANIDTRRLTRLLREKGAQNGCIITSTDAQAAIEKAKNYPGIVGQDLAKVVSTNKIYKWKSPTLNFEDHSHAKAIKKTNCQIVVYDYGVKYQILRLLADRADEVIVVPATTPVDDVLAMNPDGVFLANGPGDPSACHYAIDTIKRLLEEEVPLFGVCLGFQLLALACGAKTVKMKFGHHGANHPVESIMDKAVFITSQNHSFAVDANTLPDCLQVTHRSLFDGTLQGIKHQYKPAFAFQGHPEASPGPHDILNLFDQFIVMIEKAKLKQASGME